jgi:hypothetical protein
MPSTRVVERSFNLTKNFDQTHGIHTALFKEHFLKEYTHIAETLKREHDLVQGTGADIYCYWHLGDLWTRIEFTEDTAPET